MERIEKDSVKEIKSKLIEQLKEERAFWSYDQNEISADIIDDR